LPFLRPQRKQNRKKKTKQKTTRQVNADTSPLRELQMADSNEDDQDSDFEQLIRKTKTAPQKTKQQENQLDKSNQRTTRKKRTPKR